MKAEYTIKIGDVYYKAGQEIPDIRDSKIKEDKAVTASAEPPVSVIEEEKPEPVVAQKPAKRSYNRRK